MTDYQVVRSRRRTVALQVDQTGSVVVRAPMTLPEEEIRTFVEKHETWIHRQQQRQGPVSGGTPGTHPSGAGGPSPAGQDPSAAAVAYWAGVMGVRPTGIKITSARHGSAAAPGKTVSASPCT